MIDIDEELEDCMGIDAFKRLIARLDKERDGLLTKLGEAADILADAGRIHNTPAAKYNWINSAAS